MRHNFKIFNHKRQQKNYKKRFRKNIVPPAIKARYDSCKQFFIASNIDFEQFWTKFLMEIFRDYGFIPRINRILRAFALK